ncbi:MAG: hypothetical protein K6E98_07400 [Lachnospiraceae bacterium]|nr:hypothetical protein [Lachnospiraceae bacterium]
MKKIFEKITKNIIKKTGGISILVIIAFELLFLGFILLKSFSQPAFIESYTASEIFRINNPEFNTEGNNIIFDKTVKEGVFNSNMFMVPSGAYNYYVSYESAVSDEKDFTKSPGEFSVVSDHHEIETNVSRFNDGNNLIHGRFWVPVFSSCNDLRFSVTYNESGTLIIKEIKVEECKKYRFVRVVAFAFLFFIFDFFMVLFCTDVYVKVSKSFLVIIMIIFAASIPFLDDSLFKGHDLYFHFKRIVALSKELEYGQFPVRISTELNNGYGYVNSLYYCDLLLYIPAIMYNCAVPLIKCYELYVIMINVITCITSYLCVSKLTDNRNIRLLGVAFYVLGTYRLVNINIRAAVGEYTAMCFLPLIVMGLYNILVKEKSFFRDWLPFSLGIAGIIMSHTLTVLMVGINIVILCIIILPKVLKLSKIAALFKGTLTGIMLSAWFLIPFMDSMNNQTVKLQDCGEVIMLDKSAVSVISFLKIFSSGYGSHFFMVIGLSFMVGLLFIIYCLYTQNKSDDIGSEERININIQRILFFITIINLLFVSKYFPWNRIQNFLGLERIGYQIGNLQFVWRFLTIVSVTVPVVLVIAMDYIYKNKKKIYGISFAVIAYSILLSCGYLYYDQSTKAIMAYWNNIEANANSDNLYFLENSEFEITHISKCFVKEGNAVVNDYVKEKGVASVNVKNNSVIDSVEITMPIFAYNNYHIYDLSNVPVVTELPYSMDENGCIKVSLPPAFDGRIEICYVEPFLWRVAELISLVTLIIILFIWIKRGKSKIEKL